jgi:hypothetical protein
MDPIIAKVSPPLPFKEPIVCMLLSAAIDMWLDAKNEPKFGSGTDITELMYACELGSGAGHTRGNEFENDGIRDSSIFDKALDF